MFHQIEAKAQGWRAIALFNDPVEGPTEGLIVLGRSSTQIRATYVDAFLELYDDEQREHTQSILLQRWTGAADAGRWLNQSTLRLPLPEKLAKSA